MSKLYAAHNSQNESSAQQGVDIEAESAALGGVVNAVERGVLDHFSTKFWAIKLATDASLTILKIDQVCVLPGRYQMAIISVLNLLRTQTDHHVKAGWSTKPPAQSGHWDDD